MFKLKKLLRSKQLRLVLGIVIAVTVFTLLTLQPTLAFRARPQGDSLLYGKLADTRRLHGGHGVVSNAKVTINSLPPQTTRTDDQGQFWFKGLRDVHYVLKIELPYDHSNIYSFSTNVHGQTGEFFNIANDEEHNLHEIDY
ncbi:carboxypeptidase-like regulatory domain-containing protein [Gloeocapsopsis dulcis]|uniref:Carboxypeptidase regulatory-like domain-containing protein n=1 Tax=Gloeocapsopsis dulcis AAB1 = 1H9 TaxID=1433147 RepID=A0A6N8FU65_9CHRO|nr:carboxypeptidase-like regulatory domain-containing protein [Gloeocapsopsis dulcis]MUL35486.1 hypothetical protein [Gloeocapsopsis dulcis AAB1 = 1H9]WNN90320.1 carboxypeptidase-like regulatory domain-containing protein [Gloeocapsopsis dulcis]